MPVRFLGPCDFSRPTPRPLMMLGEGRPDEIDLRAARVI